VAGVRTGIDFGPLVGLRAFYWRGINDGFNRTQGVQGYGGEAQFALNAGPGVNPFLIAGAGQVDFLPSYGRTAEGGAAIVRPADQTALIVGGGVKIPVGQRLKLTGAARNWLAAAGGRTQDAATTGQLRSNWQYSVGLSFGIGGRGARRLAVARPRTDTVFVDAESGRRVDGREFVSERVVVTERGDTLRGAAADSAAAADRTARLVEVRRVGPDGRAGSYASDRTIQVVVPTEGEIILRYGPQRGPGGAAAYPAPPPRAFVRETRERDGRIVREYRESDGTVSREFNDDSGRPIREYREPSGRVVREYIQVPSAGAGTVVVPGAPTTQYVPGYAPSTVTVVPGQAPAYGLAPAPTPQYVPGYEPSGYAAPRDVPRDTRREVARGGMRGAAGGDVVPADALTERDVVSKSGRTPVVRGRVRTARDVEVDDRIAARLDSLERAVAARDADTGRPPAGANPDDVRAIVREELARAERARGTPTTVVTQPGAPGSVQVVDGTQPRVYYGPGTGVQGGLLYSGATVTQATQGLLGVRLDFGPVVPGLRAIRLVPELAVGVGGGGTSTYVAANALYELGPVFRVRPRVSLGAGLLNFSSPVGSRDGLSVVATPAYGVSLPFGRLRNFGGGRTPELLLEHQGVGLFDVNRVVVGLGWRN
jgi:hypothetical protein